jgi:hypothetical protein
MLLFKQDTSHRLAPAGEAIKTMEEADAIQYAASKTSTGRWAKSEGYTKFVIDTKLSDFNGLKWTEVEGTFFKEN